MSDLSHFQSLHGLSNAKMLAIGDLNGDGKISNLDLQPLLNLVVHVGGGLGGSGASTAESSVTVVGPSAASTISADRASVDVVMTNLVTHFAPNSVSQPRGWLARPNRKLAGSQFLS